MTHTLRIVFVGIISILISQTTVAQHVTDTTTTDISSSSFTYHGQRTTNVGKTIMYTGASMAMTGFVIGTVGWLANYGSLVGELSAISTIIGGITGAAVALVGLPIYCAGRHKMKTHGSSLMIISDEGQQGGLIAVEGGVGIPNYLSLNVTGGYHFNKHILVGGGIGCGTIVTPKGVDREKSDLIVPIYANTRITFGSKYVAPYVGARLGYDLNLFTMYSAIEFGTNIRRASSNKDGAWWIGTKTECLGLDLHSIHFVIGKSF